MLPPQLCPIQFSPPAPLNTALLDPNSNWEGRRTSFFNLSKTGGIFFSQNSKILVKGLSATWQSFYTPNTDSALPRLTSDCSARRASCGMDGTDYTRLCRAENAAKHLRKKTPPKGSNHQIKLQQSMPADCVAPSAGRGLLAPDKIPSVPARSA